MCARTSLDEAKDGLRQAEERGSESQPSPAVKTAEGIGRRMRRQLVRVAKSALPASFTGRLERLDRRAQTVYLRLWMMNLLGPAGIARREAPASARAFLAVCFGNIMRSPMVEQMLRRALAEHGFTTARVESAGLHAIPGRPAHPWAIEVARELAIPLDDHRARLVAPEMVERADVILAMDLENLAELLARYPEASAKTYMLGAYAEGPQQYREIPDPYFGDLAETRRCYQTLQNCVRRLVDSLEPDKMYSRAKANP
ncbi:MAG TPA: low molecular weight protein-tyrosine-phosphatase [Terriglobales bacterium]|jgi:protein-tyrosine-phosphatase